MSNDSNRGGVREGLADAVHPVDQPVHCQDACQPGCWHPKHPAQQEDGHEGVLRDARGAVDQEGEDQHGHHDLVHPHLLALQVGDVEEADDRVAGQVDEHPDGEDETGNLWVNPIFAGQALEGDREGCDGGGSAEVDEECLAHICKEAKRIVASE